MTAASASVKRNQRGWDGLAFKVLNEEVVYRGCLASILDEQASSGEGYLQAFQAAAGELPVGLVDLDQTGDTSASPVPEAQVPIQPTVIHKVSVTGVSDITCIGKPVYFSDDNVLTLTRPTRGYVVGIITRWHTSTYADVLFFGPLAMGLNGGFAQEVIYLGKYDCAAIADGNLLTAFPLSFKGKILATWAHVLDEVITGSSGTTSIDFEIDGTNLTGGQIVASTAAGNAVGKKLAGSAITAGNQFSEGSTLDIEASATTSMSAGSVGIWIEVQRLPGT